MAQMASRYSSDHCIDELEACFNRLEQSTYTENIQFLYTINKTIEPTNVLIIYVTGTPQQRLEAVADFRGLAKDPQARLSEDEGIHYHGDSYIVISNSIHWSGKYREFINFEDTD